MKVRERKDIGFYSTTNNEAILKNQFLDLVDDIYEARRKARCREVSSTLKNIEDEYKREMATKSYCNFKILEKALELCRDLIVENGRLKEDIKESIQMECSCGHDDNRPCLLQEKEMTNCVPGRILLELEETKDCKCGCKGDLEKHTPFGQILKEPEGVFHDLVVPDTDSHHTLCECVECSTPIEDMEQL